LHGYDINIRRDWWEAGDGGLRRRAYPRRLLRMARDPLVCFVAVSETIRQRAIEYGIPARKITVAQIGIDTRRFKPAGLPLSQRRNRVLFVGRMVAKKVPLLVVRAFAEVRRQLPDAEFVMIGDGPLLDEAKKLASDLRVSISFLGAVAPDQVLEQMHEAKVFCLPSVVAPNGDAEGLPISILEAQSCGVPVVTTASAANAEGIVDGIGGKIVAENDLLQLADAIKSLLIESQDATEDDRYGFPSRLDISNCTRKLESIYATAAARRFAAPGVAGVTLAGFIRRLAGARPRSWQSVERFDPAWRERIERMACFIGENARSVVDVGCGPMWLRDFLPTGTAYFGVDYVDRGAGTIVADLNRDGVPAIDADVWFVSGCLEYIREPDRFVADMSRHARKCVLSYCGTEAFPSLPERRKRGWVNDLQLPQVVDLFARNGMRQLHRETLPSNNSILVFAH
jgi:hypothetical protein